MKRSRTIRKGEKMGRKWCTGRCLTIVAVVVMLSTTQAGIVRAQSKPAVTEWEIPLLSVLTGPVAFAGMPAVWGAEYAAKEINNAGGIRGVPVKIVRYDTAFNEAKAVSAMGRVVDSSLVVLGPIDGPGGEAAGPVAAEAKVPFIGQLPSPAIRERCKPWGVAYMPDSIDGSLLAVPEWIKLNPGIKSVAVFYIPSDPAQVDDFKAVSAALTKAGAKVLGPIEVQTGQLDMGPVAVKAMNLKPDGYFCILRSDEYVKVATELYNRGMTDGKRICAVFAANSPNLLQVGKDRLNGTYIWDTFDLSYPGARWKALFDAYKAEHSGQLPIGTAAFFYDAVYAVKAVIEANNLTGDKSKLAEERTKISNSLFNSRELEGVQGKYRYVNGKKIAPYVLLQIRDNQLVRVSALIPR